MNGDPNIDIRSLILSELENVLTLHGAESFRARQVYDWLWKKNCRSFSEMTNLPHDLREMLAREFIFRVLTVDSQQKSSDGTVKTLFRLHDGLKVEGVLIPAQKRTTACLSSQVGCPLACTFCATGRLGFTRNLEFTEIYDQVMEINRQSLVTHGVPLSNIVFMGMGEPLLNYERGEKICRYADF